MACHVFYFIFPLRGEDFSPYYPLFKLSQLVSLLGLLPYFSEYLPSHNLVRFLKLPCHTSICSLELSADHSFYFYHATLLSLCDYGSGCQSYAHDLHNHSSSSPSVHSEMTAPFYPEPGTTSCSLRCIILTLAVLKHLKGPRHLFPEGNRLPISCFHASHVLI